MHKSFSKLATLIKSEITLGEKFQALLEEKKNSIISNDLSRMEELTREENETIQEIEELGYTRQDHVLELSKGNHYRITENLGDFIHQIPDTAQEVFVELRTQLVKSFEKIALASKLNAELLKQSHDFTQHMYNRITSSDRRVKNGNYQRFGNQQAGSSSTIFNTKG